uniref:Uncharacterized protein n=1 Tax=Megaselia scalaris TaxID=36166 RepID=T1H425_MEGSC
MDSVKDSFIENPSKFWNFIKEKSKTNDFPPKMCYNLQSGSTDKEICELFKQFFESVYSPQSQQNIDYEFTTTKLLTSDFPIPSISSSDVENYLRNDNDVGECDNLNNVVDHDVQPEINKDITEDLSKIIIYAKSTEESSAHHE